MTRFGPDADSETRRAQAQFEMERSGPFGSGCASDCGGWLLLLTAFFVGCLVKL